jgi:transcriptional regulator with XRE-family HTH domain
MPTAPSENSTALARTLKEARLRAGLSTADVGTSLGLNTATVEELESARRYADIELLAAWCHALNVPLEGVLRTSGYIASEPAADWHAPPAADGNNETAIPVGAEQTGRGFDLLLKWRDQQFRIPFDGSDINIYREVEQQIIDLFARLNKPARGVSNRDAIAAALELAIHRMPEANPSDIYHHIVYRLYLRDYNKTNPKQSWVRAGGEGVELFFKRHYAPLLEAHGITVELAFETGERNKFLIEMGLADQVAGGSKLDICLYGHTPGGIHAFAGVHSKASLAERVSDDKPCSERMMAAGFKSYLFTFDAKSFPPPTGDLVNYGELGTVERPSDKRGYIETHGSFDACFSYNLRTTPSGTTTHSGKRIFTSRFDQHDAFLTEVTRDWAQWRQAHGL